MDRPFIRNWRDQQPANSHGAVGWKILTERGQGKPYETSPLVGIHGLTFRMLQAGMVEPAHGTHSIVNDSDEIIDHLVISAIPHWARDGADVNCFDRGRVDPVIRNWRDDAHRESQVRSAGPSWPKKASFRTFYEQAPLEGFHGLTMHLMPPGKREEAHEHTGKEQVYYFTEGRGKLLLGDETLQVRDGDAA